MSRYLLDTHIWLWHLVGSPDEPESVRRLIGNNPEALWLSPLSVWEAGKLVETGKLVLSCGFREWAAEARQRMPVQEAPFDADVALRALDLDLATESLVDRFLVATALVHDLTFVTVDEHLVGHDRLVTFPI